MKHLKKLSALVLTIVLVLSLCVTAFAAGDTYTITINNTATGHTYEAYQIFTGDLYIKDDGTKVLSNIVWGDGVTEAGKTALGDAATMAESLKTEADAKAFAQAVAPYLQNPTSSTEGTNVYTISSLKAGYYLVKDKDNTLDNADDFYTAYMMKVVGDVTAAPKGEKPSLDKEIKHNDDGSWGVVGDNQIGDTVEFRTITTVPDTTGYTTYAYIIHDTMSSGLTSNVKSATDVTIKVNDTTELDRTYYSVEANGNTFSVTVDILAAIKAGVMQSGDSLYTYYTGVLNEDALIYDEGKQENTAFLEYSNNPNDTSDHGKTPEEKVYDWTFKLTVNKVDGNGNALTGAKFALSKNSSLKVADMKCDAQGNPTVTTDLIALVKDTDGVYHIATAAELADTSVTKVYTVDAGSPVIKGLDDATNYYLYETIAPQGYNLLAEPVHFKISATYKDSGSNYDVVNLTVGDGDKAVTSTTLSTNVVNQAGSTLPETGGIGTTIFYVVGGLLVVCAAILLITRKRMGTNR